MAKNSTVARSPHENVAPWDNPFWLEFSNESLLAQIRSIIRPRMKIKEIEYHGWKSLHITNDTLECIVPLEIGIRILHLALTQDHENCLFERITDRGQKNSNEWVLYGGHRLWFAPEHETTSYLSDNRPITYALLAEDGIEVLRLSQAASKPGIAKEVDLIFETARTMRLIHRAYNQSDEAVTLSLWPITAFAGGKAILPLPQNHRPLNPAGAIILWPYTKPDDSRIVYSNDLHQVTIEQRAETKPLKIGLAFEQTGKFELFWKRGSLCFRKSFDRSIGIYPDFGSCIECYTNHELIELETLGPETPCAPGNSVEHTETWELWREP